MLASNSHSSSDFISVSRMPLLWSSDKPDIPTRKGPSEGAGKCTCIASYYSYQFITECSLHYSSVLAVKMFCIQNRCFIQRYPYERQVPVVDCSPLECGKQGHSCTICLTKFFGFRESNSPYNFGTTQARIMNIICIHQMFPTLFGLAEIWFANYCKTHSGFTSSYTTMWLQQYKKLPESIANVFRRHQSVFCRSSTTTMIVQGADFLAED